MKTKNFLIGCLLICLCIPQCKKDDKGEEDANLIKTVTISISGEVGRDGGLTVGQEANVVAAVTPADAMEAIEWKATVENIVSITPKSGTNGREVTVKAEGEGETQIYAVSRTGGVESAKLTFTVSLPSNMIEAIALPPAQLDLYTDDVHELTVLTVTPSSTEEAIEWVSLHPSIVSVAPKAGTNGKTVVINVLDEGETQIYAVSAVGRVESNKVTVNATMLLTTFTEYRPMPFWGDDGITTDYVMDWDASPLEFATMTVLADNARNGLTRFERGGANNNPLDEQMPIGRKVLIRFEYMSSKSTNSAKFEISGTASAGNPVLGSTDLISLPQADTFTLFELDITALQAHLALGHLLTYFPCLEDWEGYEITIAYLTVRIYD